MVDVRPNACLLVLLFLVLAAPCASAGVIGRARDHVDDVAKVTGLPNVPLLDRVPDDDVKWMINDGGADVEGGGVRAEASCTRDGGAQASNCSGSVCFMDPGSGDLPVSLGEWGRGMYGVGIDLAALQGGVPIVIHNGGQASPSGADAQGSEGDGGSYGPYNGVFVDPAGQCGP